MTYVAEHLVGRAAELNAVDGLLKATAGGAGTALLLAGEPGIGKTRLLAELGALCALAAGDEDTALSTAQESFDLIASVDTAFVAGWAALALAAALLGTCDPRRAEQVLVEHAGGERITAIQAGWRAYGLELLTRCRLASGRLEDARRAAAGAAGSRPRRPCRWRRPGPHGRRRRSRSRTARTPGPPSGRARRSQAPSAPEPRSRPPLRRWSSCVRSRGRELEVVDLVVDRRTNPEIAAELFLSLKTVETHLRNVFRKLGVSSRVELAREVERLRRSSPA